jgi:hypothetical protein
MSLSTVFDDADLIHVYSRAQAIADGGLIDVSEMARQAGWRASVALTAAVWGDCVAWDKYQPADQDEQGRLWDVLTMALFAARGRRRSNRTLFTVLRIPRGGQLPEPVRLAIEIGPGDAGEPVITIMQPEED